MTVCSIIQEGRSTYLSTKFEHIYDMLKYIFEDCVQVGIIRLTYTTRLIFSFLSCFQKSVMYEDSRLPIGSRREKVHSFPKSQTTFPGLWFSAPLAWGWRHSWEQSYRWLRPSAVTLELYRLPHTHTYTHP